MAGDLGLLEAGNDEGFKIAPYYSVPLPLFISHLDYQPPSPAAALGS
jgi:hypothetical protein